MTISGRYRLVRRLGGGGAGTVYQAVDLALGRTVAIKTLDGSLPVDLLRREGGALAHLNHPNVVALYDLIESQEHPYLVMEYVDGCDLERWIGQHGPLPLAQALNVIRRVAGAILQAHERGLLHCDLKPANVLLSRSGEVKLADFTLAHRRRSTGFDGPGGGSGTYAAPEQMSGGELSPRTDVYGLGAMLHRIVDLRDLASDEGRRVVETINRAMAIDPEERFAGVDGFLAALPSEGGEITRLTASSPLSDLTRVAPTRDREPTRPRSWPLATLCAALLLALLGVFTHFTVFAASVTPAPVRVTVPDFVATQRVSAQLVARSLTLRPHIVQAYSSAPDGTVTAQRPGPGAAIPKGGVVTLVVSKGPAPVAVPDLQRLSQEGALRSLRSLGFRVVVRTQETISQPADQVVDQSVAPRTELLPGKVVVITVSRRPWWWPF